MNDFFQWLKTNSSALKDLSTIIFTAVATYIGILTYRRARISLFQPLRTEVAKRQTDMLLNLYEALGTPPMGIIVSIDYQDIFYANIYTALRSHNLIRRDENNDLVCKEVLSGQEIWLEGNVIAPRMASMYEEEFLNTLKSEKDNDVENDAEEPNTAQLSEVAKVIEQGNPIDRILLTKTHAQFVGLLTSCVNSPLIPHQILPSLELIQKDIDHNIRVVLKGVLNEAVIDMCQKLIDRAPIGNGIAFPAVYNEFLFRMKNHTESIETLKSAIRDYMKIDLKI